MGVSVEGGEGDFGVSILKTWKRTQSAFKQQKPHFSQSYEVINFFLSRFSLLCSAWTTKTGGHADMQSAAAFVTDHHPPGGDAFMDYFFSSAFSVSVPRWSASHLWRVEPERFI